MPALQEQHEPTVALSADDLTAAVKRMRLAGSTWSTIERLTGLNYWRARSRIDPEYVELTRARERVHWAARKTRLRKTNMRLMETGHMSEDEAKRLLATVPVDTRCLSQRLFGDPLPGRSALDRRQAAH